MTRLISIGFRGRQPPELEMSIDCRILAASHRGLDLHPRNCLHAEVRAYVFSTASATVMLKQLCSNIRGRHPGGAA